MKILLSAYACEPNKGSEPGVGWNWAVEIAMRGHEVVVLTRENNQKSIESQDFDKGKITFEYYDPKIILKLKKIIGINLYYSLWQFFVAFKAKKLDKEYNFDCVHHITFGVFRQISFIPFGVNKPFIFGPVGGGEMTPKNLADIYTKRQLIKERLRKIANSITYYSPLYRLFLNKTDLIVSKTKETGEYIPLKYKDKLLITLEIGINNLNSLNDILIKRKTKSILFVGRFVYWKGIQLTLETFLYLSKVDPEYELILIGKGEELNDIIEFMKKNSLTNYKIIDWIPQEELKRYYSNSTLMLFPSLHDSSGNVVLEALSHGLPVFSLNVGGPQQVIGEINTIVEHDNKNTKDLAQKIALKIIEQINDRKNYLELCNASFERSNEMTWTECVNIVYKVVESNSQFQNN